MHSKPKAGVVDYNLIFLFEKPVMLSLGLVRINCLNYVTHLEANENLAIVQVIAV